MSRVLDIYAVKGKFSLSFAMKCLFKHNGLKTPVILLILGLTTLSFIAISLQKTAGKVSDDNFFI